MSRGARAEVTHYDVPVRSAAPQAVWIARMLGWLYGKAVNGSPGNNGSIRYGWPGLDTDRTMYKGYAYPPQIFVGYDPGKVAAGFVRPDPASLPGESMTAGGSQGSLANAMAAVTTSQMASGS